MKIHSANLISFLPRQRDAFCNASKRSPEKFLSLSHLVPWLTLRLSEFIRYPDLGHAETIESLTFNTYVRFLVGSLYKRTAEYLIADSDFL